MQFHLDEVHARQDRPGARTLRTGRAADLRDTVAAFNGIRVGQAGAWIALLAAGIAWIPGVGDALKGAIRGGRKAAGEVAEEAAEQAARVARNSTEEASTVAARRTSAGEAAGRIDPEGTAPSWRRYEERYGGQQTPMETTFQGRTVRVRLDKPPSDAQIIDFKEYNWSNPRYQEAFIQERVVEDFTLQIRKYMTIHPNVHLQFSRNPPNWVVEAIERAGGTYSVAP